MSRYDERNIERGTHGTCPVCGRVLGIYVPTGGDGSMRLMRAHVHKIEGVIGTGQRCEGSKKPAWEWSW